MRRFRRITALILCVLVTMTFANGTVTFAGTEQQSAGLCEHHKAHTQECGYQEAQEEIPCDRECTDTDGDGVTDHAPDCAYTPAVEGQPCGYVCEICSAEKDEAAETDEGTNAGVDADASKDTEKNADTEALADTEELLTETVYGEIDPVDESDSKPEVSGEEAAPVAKLAAEPKEVSVQALSVKYREKGADIYENNTTNTVTSSNNMYCVVPVEVRENLDGYTFQVQALNEEPTSIDKRKVRIAGGTGTYALWEYAPKKAGTYTVTITKDGGEKVAEGTIDIVSVTFHTGEDGSFEGDGQKEHTSYYKKPTYTYEVYFDRYGNIPKVNTTGQDFIGWSDKQAGDLVNYADLFTLMGLQKDTAVEDAYHVYAVYGTKKVWSYEIIDADDGGKTYNSNAEYDMGEVHAPYDSTENKKILTIKNTGNQTITITPINNSSYPISFLDITYQGPNGEITGNQPITIPQGQEGTIILTPKANLAAGVHNGTFSFRINEKSLIHFLNPKLTVISGTLEVIPEAKTKTYGQTLRASDIKVGKIVYENTDKEYNDTLESLGVTLDSQGFKKDAAAGSYTYTLNTSTNPSVTVKLAPNAPKVTVEKDTPQQSSLKAAGVHVGSQLSASKLSGTFVNSNDPEMGVTGTLEWVNPQQSVGVQEGTIQADWKFTPHDDKNYNPTFGTVEVSVSEKNATNLFLIPGCQKTVIYDGRKHVMEYTSNRVGDDTPIEVKYRPLGSGEEWTEDAPVNAGTYDVEVSVAEGEEYAAATMADTLTIEQKTLHFSNFSVYMKTYDGTKTATLDRYFSISGLVDSGVGATVEAEFESPNANPQARALIKVTGLTGSAAANYKLPDNPVYHTYATIFPRTLKIQSKEFTKGYGTLLYLTEKNFEITGLVPGDSAGLEFVSEGELAAANVRAAGYPITAKLTNTNYTFNSYSNATPKLTTECGSILVTKVKPEINGSISAGAGRKECELDHVALTGGFVNPNNADLPVKGKLTWKEAGVTLPEDQDSYVAKWVFTPEDQNNYDPLEGEVTIVLLDKEPIHITVEGNTEVTYDGNPHGLTVKLDPAEASHTVEYCALGSENENAWTTEQPINAGIYNVRVNAFEYGEYTGNQVTAHMTIVAAEPESTAPTELTVQEGTAVNSTEVRSKFEGCFTFHGEPVEGTFTWTIPEGVVTDDRLEFMWVFIPDHSNYTIIGGMTTFYLADDAREISAVVYNLPVSLGYDDYAVVRIEESGLKAGDEVTFFKDGAQEDPVSDSVMVTDEDMGKGSLLIWLDDDALQQDKDGTLYARITSSKKNPVTTLSYYAEPGFILEDNGGGPEESILVHPDFDTKVSARLLNNHYTVQSVDFSIQDAAGIVEMTLGTDAYTRNLRGKMRGGDAVLVATITFRHPDPIYGTGNITITLTKGIICNGSLDVGAQSGEGAPEVTVDEEEMRDTFITEADRKDLADGNKINYLLNVNKKDESRVDRDERTEIEAAVVKENKDFVVGQYLDIMLMRTVNDVSPEKIETTKIPLTITIDILPELMEKAREATNRPQFVVVRMHQGKVTVLNDEDDNPDTVTIKTDQFSTYAIAYRNPVGDLTVKNTVTSDKDKAFTFTVTLDDKSISGEYGKMTFKDGAAMFTLKDGESLTAAGLPAGVKYTVTEAEADRDGYTTTSEGASDTIQEAGSVAAFTNVKKSEPQTPEDPTQPSNPTQPSTPSAGSDTNQPSTPSAGSGTDQSSTPSAGSGTDQSSAPSVESNTDQSTTPSAGSDTTRTDAAKTGDISAPAPWMMAVLFAGTVLGLCAVGGLLRRRERRDR